MQALLKSSVAVLVLALAGLARGSTDVEGVAIEAVARDYLAGFLSADVTRMRHALHPELVRRMLITDPKTHKSSIDSMSAGTLLERLRARPARTNARHAAAADLIVLDHLEETAMVKVVASDSIDYLQMARFDGQWKIVNVLGAARLPAAPDASAGGASAGKSGPLPSSPSERPPGSCSSRAFLFI